MSPNVTGACRWQQLETEQKPVRLELRCYSVQMDEEREHHYVVSHDDQGPLYIACTPARTMASGTSTWFITRDRNEAADVGSQLEAREIAEELNGKAIEAVYDLADPEKRRWVIVNRFD